jgi:hypothetical protein
MKRTSAVTLMAYRNTATGPDGTLDVAAAELAAAASLGRPVRIGQETNRPGHGPHGEASRRFAGMTVGQMQQQLTAVDEGAASLAHLRRDRIHDWPASARWPLNSPPCTAAGGHAATTVASHLADCARGGPE